MILKSAIYREAKYYVAHCLNVDVSSFGETIQEAQDSLKEAVELYFENETDKNDLVQIDEVLLGETFINA